MLISKRRVQSPKRKDRSYELGMFLCDECGKEFERKINPALFRRSPYHFCDMSCRTRHVGKKNKGKTRSSEWKRIMSVRNSGSGNPFFGKHHTEKTLDKIKKTRQEKLENDPNAYSRSGSKPGDFSGQKNPFYGKKHTKETREHLSSLRAKLVAEGKVSSGPRGIHGYYTSKKTGKVEHHDSIWELLRMHLLDADPFVKSWTKQHGIRIPYLDNENQRNYIPDFLVIENDQLVVEEIKGYENPARLQAKLAALEEYGKSSGCVTRVLTDRELNLLSKEILSETLSSFFKKAK